MIEKVPATDEGQRFRQYAVRWWDATHPGGNPQTNVRFKGYDQHTVPAAYASNRSIASLVKYIIEEKWRTRLRPTLQSIVCAYVPPGAPALAADVSLRNYHEDMRKLLLGHPARREVELDMIPDPEYRAAMAQAQMHGAFDMVAPGAAVLGEGMPPDLPGSGPALPNDATASWWGRHWGKVLVGVGLGGAAATAATVAVRRR